MSTGPDAPARVHRFREAARLAVRADASVKDRCLALLDIADSAPVGATKSAGKRRAVPALRTERCTRDECSQRLKRNELGSGSLHQPLPMADGANRPS